MTEPRSEMSAKSSGEPIDLLAALQRSIDAALGRPTQGIEPSTPPGSDADHG